MNDTGVIFNFLVRQILKKLIISNKHVSLEQMHSYLQRFFSTGKISLNERLGSTVTDYMLLIFIVISLVINNDSL